MVNLTDIIKSCNLSNKDDLDTKKFKCKRLTQYINIDFTKKYIDKLVNELVTYKKIYFNDNEILVKKQNIVLTDEQKLIIYDNSKKNTRIIAGAGSGKTTTVLCKVKYLIDNMITPNKILILTFNRSTCDDIKKKILHLFGFDIKIEIYTIDKFCNILKYMYTENVRADKQNQKNIQVSSVSELGIIGEKIMEKYGKEISKRYEYVFFDEFQDVNSQQFNILSTFAKNNSVLVCVGDENQNIYQFRGTDNYYILNFDKLINNNKTLSLTQNYRSTKEIVELANNSINYNITKTNKKMYTLDNSHTKPSLHVYESESDILNFIFNDIKVKINGQNLKYHDFAILSRNGFPLKNYETYCIKNNTPCVTLLSNKHYDYNAKSVVKDDHLTISTIHSAKGLEWNTVYVIGLSDEHFPSHVNNNIQNIEEERRLFYVGTTRAKKSLYFLSSIKEIPLTRFIHEIIDNNVIEINNRTDINLFDYNDKNHLINTYSVTGLITSLNGEMMNNMKENDIIPYEIKDKNITNIFNSTIEYNSEIIDKNLEAEFGIFCDLVFTRNIMLHTEQKIEDKNTLWILNGIELSDVEMEIYNKYDLKTSQDPMKYYNIKDNNERLMVFCLLKKINPKYEIRRHDTYPNVFLTKLKAAYVNYCDKTKKNKDIMEDIYYISLSNKIKDNRRRLIYMNVYEIFMNKFDKTNERIENYADMIKSKNNVCKCNISRDVKKQIFSYHGEMDLIDIDNNVIIDFKCSIDNNLKLEWIIQVMMYYCMYSMETDNDIDYVGIFNVITGIYWKLRIPSDYNVLTLLKYIDNHVINISNGERKLKNNGEILVELTECENKPLTVINEIPLSNNTIGTNMMIFDVESNCEKMELLQISYIILDENYQYVKKENRYVKDRVVSQLSYSINHITNDMLKKGDNIDDIMKIFIKDLENCNTIIGHNIMSDCRAINKEYSPVLDLFENKKIICTMKENKFKCNLKNIKGGIKNPKLEELYYYFFKQTPRNFHDAMADVVYTTKCFFMMELKITDLIKIISNMTIENYCSMHFDVLEKMLRKQTSKIIYY
ncbi:Uvr helicase/DDEDDh 3'-5' exonuclease [Bodo saltans virus]|uniref:DNA 3'-5' helicase n=1 Tax=Bodo saltans virus TaxID=2024608 RepID=A0A2H4UW05_9VIRU|nr:Uvr helicase/DDEDDh 3'-5' exonuclease [Bodo saltans virus]ATZ81100.1 Uvr helicase/DDEDDh 3'-5' exonuclease [Bodo saltans virus]